MSSAAYSNVTETERRKIANHMTHRPETAYKAYSAKNRRSDAVESVSKMNDLMYGDVYGCSTSELANNQECDGSIVPSSAGALTRALAFSEAQLSVLQKEARRLGESGAALSMAKVMQIMARHKPVFDCRSPKSVESKLRSLISELGNGVLRKRRRV